MSIRRAILAVVLTILPGAAFADTLTVYQVTGSFLDTLYSVPQGTLGGNLTFDVTTGTFTANTLGFYSTGGSLVQSFRPAIVQQSLLPDGRYELEMYTYDLGFGPPPYNYAILDLKLPALPVPDQSLNICSLSTVCTPPAFPTQYESSLESVTGVLGQYRSDIVLASGQLAPAAGVAIAPEPSSFALLGTGLFALCFFARYRLPRIRF